MRLASPSDRVGGSCTGEVDQEVADEARMLIPVVQVVAFAAVLAGPAPADPPRSRPGGPCIEGEQTVQLSSVPSYEEVTRALRSIEASSGGRVEVASAGMSGEGRGSGMPRSGTVPMCSGSRRGSTGTSCTAPGSVPVLRYLGSSSSRGGADP